MWFLTTIFTTCHTLYQNQFPNLSLQSWHIIAFISKNERGVLIPGGCQNSCYHFPCTTLYFSKCDHNWSNLCLQQFPYTVRYSFPFYCKKTETKIGQIVYLILRFNHLKDSFEEFNFLKICILRNLIVL